MESGWKVGDEAMVRYGPYEGCTCYLREECRREESWLVRIDGDVVKIATVILMRKPAARLDPREPEAVVMVAPGPGVGQRPQRPAEGEPWPDGCEVETTVVEKIRLVAPMALAGPIRERLFAEDWWVTRSGPYSDRSTFPKVDATRVLFLAEREIRTPKPEGQR